MNYFFAPVLPGLRTNITLNNFPALGSMAPYGDPLRVYIAWPDGKAWNLRAMGRLEAGRSEVYRLSDVPDLLDKPLLLYCLFPEEMAESVDKLPVNDFMAGAVSWRANVQLASDKSVVSFQGEFPDAMLRIAKGSLSSVGPMVQGGEAIQTKILLISARETAEIEPRRLVAKYVKSGKTIADSQVWTNTCNIVDLGQVAVLPTDPIGLFSPDMAAIPLYFTHDADYEQMSFEHTHPPVELMAFGRDRWSLVARVKEYWLSKL